jgi:CBS domain-containing protein
MASNPQWCMPLSAWKKQFAGWIHNPTPEALLEINVFLDIHCAYGDHALADALKHYALEEAAQNPQFFIHFARNSLLYKAPLNFLGHIRAEKRAGLKTVNIKESLKPIEILARIYAFKHQIVHTNTTERLKQLMTQDILHEQTYREMMYVFDYLWDLRFYNQIITHADLDRVNDELDLDKLTDIERHNLRNVLSKITTFQTHLSYDFLGSSGTLH